eukprot:1370803-Rhodomonas_salina.2
MRATDLPRRRGTGTRGPGPTVGAGHLFRVQVASLRGLAAWGEPATATEHRYGKVRSVSFRLGPRQVSGWSKLQLKTTVERKEPLRNRD